MEQHELDKMAEWLRDQAERLEQDEPYATNTIACLKGAADYVDSAEPGDT